MLQSKSQSQSLRHDQKPRFSSIVFVQTLCAHEREQNGMNEETKKGKRPPGEQGC